MIREYTPHISKGVKMNLRLPMYDAPNAVGELKHQRKNPAPEKVEVIKDALKYFRVI